MKMQTEERLEMTEPELELIIDLLEREHASLPAEIHHTDSMDFRNILHQRQQRVEALLARLRSKAHQ